MRAQVVAEAGVAFHMAQGDDAGFFIGQAEKAFRRDAAVVRRGQADFHPPGLALQIPGVGHGEESGVGQNDIVPRGERQAAGKLPEDLGGVFAEGDAVRPAPQHFRQPGLGPLHHLKGGSPCPAGISPDGIARLLIGGVGLVDIVRDGAGGGRFKIGVLFQQG